MIEFKGRALFSQSGKGEAIVTKNKVCFVKTFGKSAENKSKKLIINDKKHADIHKKNIAGKVFVLKQFKKSDIDATMLLSLAEKGNLPTCFLVAEKLDETIISVFCVLKTFFKNSLSVIDNLGENFLSAVENGDIISFNDNLVTINL